VKAELLFAAGKRMGERNGSWKDELESFVKSCYELMQAGELEKKLHKDGY
jgi:hypothetical protein